FETKTPTISALIVREYNDEPSNCRSVMSLEQVMKQYGAVGISGVDTRKLVRQIRDGGSCRAMITDASTDTG
ncbi:carbamoyl-phosphate synthase domain-containing protein, partial [Klebsiella pneumoniae]|uniref:carbamoyl-phosphate synthase domain-containing protein n=1 Tax=Klebsiella pneumoniae TaxID=573 RepID=UPI0025A2D991